MSWLPFSRQFWLSVALTGRALPLLGPSLGVRLTGGQRESLKPRDSHQLCPAQFWGVTSILSVLEHYEA